MKRFNEIIITRPDYSDTLTVRVYKTNKKMMNGCARTCKRCGYNMPAGEYIGAWIDMPDAKCRRTKLTARPVMYGVMLLNEENMKTDVIAHECLHAAFSHNKYINSYSGNYSDEEHEEDLVRYFQWLLDQVLLKLKKAGYKVK